MAMDNRSNRSNRKSNMNRSAKSNRSSMSGNRINIKLPMRVDNDANNRMDNS